ncbi:MAG: hypothetical protein D6815_06355 [Candidatus Dadabacteria bacterium]|nr:MAG: hypothetical protein D6815_06355 [Candidatus Dadabacteria bacterium]
MALAKNSAECASARRGFPPARLHAWSGAEPEGHARDRQQRIEPAQKSSVRRRRSAVVLAAALVCCLTLAAGRARASDDYTDRSDYLFLADRIVRPVGALVDAVAVKPFVAISELFYPRPAQRPAPCRGLRPRRGCGRER